MNMPIHPLSDVARPARDRLGQRITASLEDAVSSSPYETAAVALALRDPSLCDWLVRRQHADGSWGGRAAFAADRLLQTLMVVRALNEVGPTHPTPDLVQAALVRGRDYLCGALRDWDDRALATCDLAGFELLLPAHWHALARTPFGAVLPPIPEGIRARWRRKVELLPLDVFASLPPSHVLHAAEALEAWPNGEQLTYRIASAVDPDRLAALSPSATAYLLHAGRQDASRRDRLARALRRARNWDGGYASTTPMDSFIALWNQYFALSSERPDFAALAGAFDATIARHDPAVGVGCSPDFLPDADDTAVALYLAARLGRPAHAPALTRALLDRFFRPIDGLFRTYPFEMTGSLSTNAHAVEALRAAAPLIGDHDLRTRATAAARRATDYLLSVDHAAVRDKWHVSPLYAALASARALRGAAPDTWRRTMQQWVLDTQQRSGAWGVRGDGTPEETAYALLTLAELAGSERHEAVRVAVRRGMLALDDRRDARPVELWIDKTLYQPSGFLRAVYQAARARGARVLVGEVRP